MICRSAHGRVLWVMDMADHVTFVYSLQVYLEGEKEVKQIGDFHLKMKTI